MIKKLKITVVVDNSTSKNLLSEHGLSFYIEADDKKILFDTGKGKAFEENFETLKIDANKLDYLVLSHGHYDHTNGIGFVLKNASDKLKLFLHKKAFESKYSVWEDGVRNIGMSKGNILEINKLKNRLIFTNNYTKIDNYIFVTGEIPKEYNIDESTNYFYTDEAGENIDYLIDDQSMFFNTEKGIVVLLGCCHSGLENTLNYIAELAKVNKIYAVIGGMHLKGSKQEDLNLVVDSFIKYDVKLLAPCHCTGQKETAFIYSKFPKVFSECFAGKGFLI